MLSLAQLLLMPNIMGVDMVATAVDMVAIAVDMVAMDVDTERGLLMPSLPLLRSQLLMPMLMHTMDMEAMDSDTAMSWILDMQDMGMDMDMDMDTERGLLMPSLAMDMDMPEDMDMAEDMDMDTMDKWMIILRVLDTVTILVKL